MARTIDAGRRVSSRLFLTSTFALPRLHHAAGPIVWPPRPSSGATNEGLACPLNNVRCKRSCYPWLSCCLNLLRESRDQANPAWFPVGIQAVLAGCEVWVMTIAIAKAPDETADITSGNDPDLPASLLSFILVAKFLGVPADAGQIAHDHGSPGERYQLEDLARIAKRPLRRFTRSHCLRSPNWRAAKPSFCSRSTSSSQSGNRRRLSSLHDGAGRCAKGSRPPVFGDRQ